MLIDTHCHLDFSAFDGQREQVIACAREVGVEAIVVPGVTAAHWGRLLQLCAGDYEGVRLHPALGLHPCFMAEHQSRDLEWLQQLVVEHRETLVAIGEIGLDFQHADADRQAQLALLTEQLRLARTAQLPVLLHVRKAHDQVLKLLRRFQLPRGGIVHAFSGSEQQAQQYAQLGFKLGFGGAISYPRATRLQHLAQTLPLEWLVLETDAPDMPLSDWRGEPNRPQRVAEVARIIADLRQLPVKQVAQTTRATARRLLWPDQLL